MAASKFWISQLMRLNCLLFGQNTAVTPPKVTQYLLGTRETIEIVKMYELRYLLLKTYPLIHNLFSNPRPTSQLTVKKIWKENVQGVNPFNNNNNKSNTFNKSWVLTKPLRKTNISTNLKNRSFSEPRVLPFKIKTTFSFKRQNWPPQILFASITPKFSKIIAKAAQICNMPWHEKRWLNGSITAAISLPSDKLVWQYLQDSTQNKIFAFMSKKWGTNKENEEKIKEKIKYYGNSRWPSLLIIPDVVNNLMILKEAKKVGLPVMGLINSNCPLEIEYPIFAQDQTLQSIHFFCQFLSILITKETLFFQHKRYTLQKLKKFNGDSKNLSKKLAKNLPSEKLENPRNKLRRQKNKYFQRLKKPWRKPFFFTVVRPWQWRRSRRYWLVRYKTIDKTKYKTRYKTKFLKQVIFPYRKINFVHPFMLKIIYGGIENWLNNYRKRKSFFLKRSQSKKKIPQKKSRFFDLKHEMVLKAGRVLFAKSIFKNFKISFRKLRKNTTKKPRITSDKNILKKEYQKKYFQKKNILRQEKKLLHHKFQNFLSISKIIRQRMTYYKIPGTKISWIGFPRKPTNYFWWSLKQWSQNVKWQNNRDLIYPTLKLRPRRRHNIYGYKSLFYPRGYKHDPNNPVKPWETWTKKYRAKEKELRKQKKLNQRLEKPWLSEKI